MPQRFQRFVDAIIGNSQKELDKRITEVAQDRRQQAALEQALHSCSADVNEGRITDSDFWTCVDVRRKQELQKPARITAEYTPTAPTAE